MIGPLGWIFGSFMTFYLGVIATDSMVEFAAAVVLALLMFVHGALILIKKEKS